MSLTQKNKYSIGDCDLTSLMVSADLQRRDKQAISLTNYDNTNEPKIAAGSIVELGGALLGCDADEPITGWAGIGNDNSVYIKLVPSGYTATAVFTIAAPTWSTSKQGWYVGNDRYIGGLYKDASGNYTRKWLFLHSANKKFRLLGTGDISFSGADLTADDVATGANVNLSADNERTSSYIVYDKSKEIVCPFHGTINVYFEIKTDGGEYPAYGRIYKNGTPIGTERSTASITYVPYDEDISFVPGDKIQLYIHGTGDVQMRVQNFRLRSNKTLGTILKTIFNHTLVTVDVNI